ncbi:methyltransferase domain-containing protein [Paenibacillus aquistagni]|uniref:methyltransferase domain-containing protein n=1 Tax=Paenibacillus aquistagni TaxID=1852522 RepID=UPI0023F66FC7|nr:methyltransferase domain-containing protein [Paenibacillus aquistagni]
MRGGSGAQQVIAMDFSMEMLKGAKEYCNDVDNIIFAQGHAVNTNLDEGEIDVLLERALIHHISDLESCFHKQTEYKIEWKIYHSRLHPRRLLATREYNSY